MNKKQFFSQYGAPFSQERFFAVEATDDNLGIQNGYLADIRPDNARVLVERMIAEDDPKRFEMWLADLEEVYRNL